MTDDPLTALGELLEAARGKRSIRSTAAAAGISEGRWRQIVTGVEKRGKGVRLPTNTKRSTVIAMAGAVGVDVNEALHRAGFIAEPLDVAENGTPSEPAIATEGSHRVGIGDTDSLLRAVRLIEEAHAELARLILPATDVDQTDPEIAAARERYARRQRRVARQQIEEGTPERATTQGVGRGA